MPFTLLSLENGNFIHYFEQKALKNTAMRWHIHRTSCWYGGGRPGWADSKIRDNVNSIRDNIHDLSLKWPVSELSWKKENTALSLPPSSPPQKNNNKRRNQYTKVFEFAPLQ